MATPHVPGRALLNRVRRALIALALAVPVAAVASGAAAQDSPRPPDAEDPQVRFFFITDVHSKHHVFEEFLHDVERDEPDLVVEGGDFVHDGTWPAFERAYADRERLPVPWHMAKGNHDARRSGPFPRDPPALEDFDAFTRGGVRFILLDNHEQRFVSGQLTRLEEELEGHDEGPVIVAMHVPAMLVREPLITRMRHFVPLDFAEPTMEDPEEVDRFMELMARYDVTAVITGHAHVHNDFTRDGVRYVSAGTAGGLVPGMGIQREYLDVEVRGGDVEIRRVQLLPPAREPFTLLYRTFRFFARVNAFNHAELGWNYVPTGSVQWRLGGRYTEAPEAEGGGNAAAVVAASFEGLIGAAGRTGVLGDLEITAAPRELVGHAAAGSRLRPVGDYNRNAYLSGAGTLNAGMIRSSATAGLGLRAEVGVEWDWLTLGVRYDWATNHRATGVVLGRRY